MNQEPILPKPEPIIPPSIPPARKFSPILILAVVILLIAVGAGGIFLGKSFNTSQPSVQPTVAPLPTQILTPTPDETANWKTYAFQPIRLNLKVPSELTVHTEEPNPGNDFTAYIQNYPYNSPYPGENAYQLYIIWQKTPTLTQTEFQQLKDDLTVNSIEETAIGGYPAIKGQVKGERNRFVTYILKENTRIVLATSGPTAVNKQLTDEILSTFKFTSP